MHKVLTVWFACTAAIATLLIIAEIREYDEIPMFTNIPDDKAIYGFDYDIGAWTNAAGWYCAVGGQRPDKPPCGGDRTRED